MQIQLSDHFTIGRLIRFALPSIAMMVFTSVYIVVDGFFVSNFTGKTSFAAVNLIMPFLLLLSTVGFMFGTGGSALVAKTLGEGDREKANRLFSLCVLMAVAVGILFTLLGNVFIRPFVTFLGADGELLENAVLYGRIVLASLPFFVSQIFFTIFFVTAEKPKFGLAVTILAGMTNIVLDAVLVLSLPQEYKLMGAAAATAVSEVLGGTIPLVYFVRKNSSLLRLGRTSFDGEALRRACINGSSEFMSNVSVNIVGMLYNIQLLTYAGENGVAAYGVMLYVSMIFSGICMGYSIGVAPVISFHDGAKNYGELKGLLRKSLFLICCSGLTMMTAAQVFARTLAYVFVAYDDVLMELTVSGFRVYAVSFLFMDFAVFGSGFFTALNDGLTSALISFMRTMVFQVSCVLILPAFFGLTGIWSSDVVAECMAALMTLSFMAAKRKKYHY